MKKQPNPVDIHVGARVRQRRMTLNMSQEALAHRLGLTFQQVQKYEKATNRIGAGRLYDIAKILGVPVAWFYEGLPAANTKGAEIGPDPATTFLTDRDGLAIANAFGSIRSAKVRRSMAELVENLAGASPR